MLIPFNEITKILSDYNVDFEWEENEYDKAMNAWNVFSSLSDNEKYEIGEKMISVVKEELIEYVEKILDDTIQRELKQIVIEMHTNKNEVFKYIFDAEGDAIKFLDEFNGKFDITQFKTI